MGRRYFYGVERERERGERRARGGAWDLVYVEGWVWQEEMVFWGLRCSLHIQAIYGFLMRGKWKRIKKKKSKKNFQKIHK